MRNQKKMHVMLVDHEGGILAEAGTILKQYGIMVTTVDTALKIMHCLSKIDIEVVLLNADLVVIDGFEVLRQIKFRFPYVQVIVFSEKPMREAEKTVFKLIGAFDLLNWPMEKSSLLQKVQGAWVKNKWKKERHRKIHPQHSVYCPVDVYDSGYMEDR